MLAGDKTRVARLVWLGPLPKSLGLGDSIRPSASRGLSVSDAGADTSSIEAGTWGNLKFDTEFRSLFPEPGDAIPFSKSI